MRGRWAGRTFNSMTLLAELPIALDWPKLTVIALVLAGVLTAIGKWEESRRQGGSE
jgi:hypothetical protein